MYPFIHWKIFEYAATLTQRIYGFDKIGFGHAGAFFSGKSIFYAQKCPAIGKRKAVRALGFLMAGR